MKSIPNTMHMTVLPVTQPVSFGCTGTMSYLLKTAPRKQFKYTIMCPFPCPSFHSMQGRRIKVHYARMMKCWLPIT